MSVCVDSKEVEKMKKILHRTMTLTAVLTIIGLILTGCASQQTAKTTPQFDETWRFVPRVHVEDNSFGVTGGGDYRNCSYDIDYEGYWCPPE